MENKKIAYQESMPLQEAVEYLKALIDDLEQGEFTLTSDGDSLSFKPMEKVKLEVELERKKGKEELEIELSWEPEGAGGEEEDEEDGEEDDEEKENVKSMSSPSVECGESAPEAHGAKGMSRVLPLAGLAITGALITAAVRKRRKKGKFEKALERSRKEVLELAEQADRLIEEAEEALQQGKKEAAKWLSRMRGKAESGKASAEESD